MKQTTLHDQHVALGAKMVDFAGWHMPVQYGSILDGTRRVREHAGLFDLGHMGRLHVGGPDALPFLDSVATNYVARIPVGSIRYTCFCREDGNPIDDALLYRQDDGVYIVVNASNTAAVLEWFAERKGKHDVLVDDRTEATAMIALQGPRSLEVLQQVTEGVDLAGLGYYKFTFGDVCGLENVHISRTGYTGEDGFELTFPAGEATRVWSALLEAGSPLELRPVGLGARDILRLEAGMALYGHEIDAEHNPIEAGLSFAISFKEEKGDWVGREALLAVRANPTRRMLGLTTEGPRIPRQGTPVYDGEREVGMVCSGAKSPTLGTNVATAYLQHGSDVADAELELDFRGRRQPARLQELPFFSRTRK